MGGWSSAEARHRRDGCPVRRTSSARCHRIRPIEGFVPLKLARAGQARDPTATNDQESGRDRWLGGDALATHSGLPWSGRRWIPDPHRHATAFSRNGFPSMLIVDPAAAAGSVATGSDPIRAVLPPRMGPVDLRWLPTAHLRLLDRPLRVSPVGSTCPARRRPVTRTSATPPVVIQHSPFDDFR